MVAGEKYRTDGCSSLSFFIEFFKDTDDAVTLALNLYSVLHVVLIQLLSEGLTDINGTFCISIHFFSLQWDLQEFKVTRSSHCYVNHDLRLVSFLIGAHKMISTLQIICHG